MNNNSSNIDGVLLVNKDANMTSHDVVAVARKSLKIKKIGHCGTLDPMATGLLILVIGKATKIQSLLMSDNKRYKGSFELGKTTSTQDFEGDIESENEVPNFSSDEIESVFELFKGNFNQIPPMMSAIKKDGTPLHKLARQGKVVERDPRPVTVFDYKINKIKLPIINFDIICSKGFYVRTYAHDIGQSLKCGAYLKSLERTHSGAFDLNNSINFNDLKHGSRDMIISKVLSLSKVSLMRENYSI